MEKIRLKFAFAVVLVLCVFSCFFVFAQEGGENGDNQPQLAAEAIADGATGELSSSSSNGGTSADENAGNSTYQQNVDPANGAESQSQHSPSKPDDSKNDILNSTARLVQYTVTFDAEGGSKVSAQKIKNGIATELPGNPTKKSYQFGGWFTERDGSGTEFNVGTRVDKDITVYAKWIPEYTVTFDAEGGSKVSDQKIESGIATELPGNPTKKGYQFGGWFTERDGSGTEFNVGTRVDKDITVYAKWISLESIKISELETEIEKLKTKIQDTASNHRFISLIVMGVFALFLVVFIALTINSLLSAKSSKGKIDELNEKVGKIEKKYKEYNEKIEQRLGVIGNSPNLGSSSLASITKEVENLKEEINNIKNHVQKSESYIYNSNKHKEITRDITSGNISVPDAFNRWAASPSITLLPETFCYIEGEMGIRSPREIRESDIETKWITNRQGAQKYLFPNPNSFYEMTDIHNLYKMDQTKLKGKGQNKIKIVKPCEMTKDGFVPNAGELELL
jgi:uncharacterized repeat protein (TIGR02543 family)